MQSSGPEGVYSLVSNGPLRYLVLHSSAQWCHTYSIIWLLQQSSEVGRLNCAFVYFIYIYIIPTFWSGCFFHSGKLYFEHIGWSLPITLTVSNFTPYEWGFVNTGLLGLFYLVWTFLTFQIQNIVTLTCFGAQEISWLAPLSGDPLLGRGTEEGGELGIAAPAVSDQPL